jgi:hypothetical protein
MTPYWELHILPMFRFIDRDHMLGFGIDLHDYQSVVDHADDIAELVTQTMPPTSTGGLWPPQWADLFSAWIAAGTPRLGLVPSATYTLAVTGGKTVLTCTGTLSDFNAVWLERNNNNEPREYTLVYRPDKGPAKPFRVTEKLLPTTMSVFVTDGAGKHQIDRS